MKSKLFLACLALLWLPGCYLLKQGKGQLDLRFSQVPIQEALDQESNPNYRRLLREIPQIKAFAERQLLLQKSDNYTGYYRTSRPGVSFVVTASPKTELKPHTWWFPIIGTVPYKGYFNQEEAGELSLELQKQGFDTWVFAAPAYSTLGWFKDPVTTPMIRRGHYYLVSTIIHEMTHETLYVSGEGAFNEQLASFVGKTGALLYFQEVRGLNQQQMAVLKEKINRSRMFAKIVKSYLPRFQKLYSRQGPVAEVMDQRQALFGELEEEIARLFPNLPADRKRFNNARLLQYRRYSQESPVFRKMWRESQNDWGRFWELTRVYADALKNGEVAEGKKLARVVENIPD